MRPTSVVCVWCRAPGIAMGIPGSVCHGCKTVWHVGFWDDMKLPERRAACERLSTTVDRMFGEGTTARLSRWQLGSWTTQSVWKMVLEDAVEEATEKLRGQVDDEIFLQLTTTIDLTNFNGWAKKDIRP